jgi:hypothetical protein
MHPAKTVLAILALVGFASAGCNRVVPTNEVETREIRAELWAISEGPETTTVRAYFLRGDRWVDALELGEGDRVWAEMGGRRVFLKQDPDLPSPDYIARFPGVRPGERFRFGLERRKGVAAAGNFGVFPPGFKLEPIPGRRSRARALEVRWAPALDGPMEVWVDGDCIHFATFNVPENRGVFTIPAGRLEFRRRSEAESCEAEVTVRRLRAGRIDPALDAKSHVGAAQERRVSFISVP